MTTQPPTDKAPTARERARTEITAEILAAARRRLTGQGPGELSLRAVARDVGMVSSAVYRYYASRDDLLTALLLVAYNELGEAAEDADASVKDRTGYLKRWTTTCRAVRAWAIAHPGDYALIYGSPIPGYAAPQDTITAATRVVMVLIGIGLDAHANGATIGPAPAAAPRNVKRIIKDALGFLEEHGLAQGGDAPELALRLIGAWTSLFGTISFELFGHLVGSVTDNGAYFDQVVIRQAVELGLSP